MGVFNIIFILQLKKKNIEFKHLRSIIVRVTFEGFARVLGSSSNSMGYLSISKAEFAFSKKNTYKYTDLVSKSFLWGYE